MTLELTMVPLGTRELMRRRRHSERLSSTQLPQRLLLADAARKAPPPPATSCDGTHADDALGAERLGAADVAAQLEEASQDTSRRGHFLVHAPYGCGKSTVLQQVAVHLARSGSLVPIPLRGAELARRLEGRMEQLGHCVTPEARQEARTEMPSPSPQPPTLTLARTLTSTFTLARALTPSRRSPRWHREMRLRLCSAPATPRAASGWR